MSVLSVDRINACSNFTSLHALVKGHSLEPYLSTLIKKTSTLIQDNYGPMNFEYFEVEKLNEVCVLFDYPSKEKLSSKEKETLNHITLAARDKFSELNSPYKNVPFSTLADKLQKAVDDELETKKLKDSIAYQLTQIAKENPTGEKMVELMQSNFDQPISAHIASFVASKVSARELCIFSDKVCSLEIPSWKDYIINLIGTYFFKMPTENLYTFVDLQPIFGSAFKDASYTISPCIVTAFYNSLQKLKEIKGSELMIGIDNSEAGVPDKHLFAITVIINQISTNQTKIPIIQKNSL